MEISITINPSESDIADLQNGLRDHNVSHLGEVFHEDFACFTTLASGGKSGGLYGDIWGRWLIIKYLWVDKSERNLGLGSNLLCKAEEYAISRGCHFAFLDTFSFQARPFYEKHGYEVQMTLHDYPVLTSERFYLTKQLAVKTT